MGRIVRISTNSQLNQQISTIITSKTWLSISLDILSLAWSLFLDYLKGVDLVNKDVIVMVDQIVKDVVKADNGLWTNLLKKLEDKLNLNNLLEQSMTILQLWIPSSMLSMVIKKLPTILKTILRNVMINLK